MEWAALEKDNHRVPTWIIHILDENDPRPLWVCVWGGPNTLAQALYKIKQTRSEADADILVKKLRVYTISDQDDTGIWMRQNFPDLFYIVSPGGYKHRHGVLSTSTFPELIIR